MRKTSAEILDYYDEEVVKMISEKYNLEQMKALSLIHICCKIRLALMR